MVARSGRDAKLPSMNANSSAPPQAALWRYLLAAAPGEAPPAPGEIAPGDVAYVAALTSPYTAQALLNPAAGVLDAALVEQSRLINLYALQVQRRALGELAAVGVDAVALKGFAHAHLHYARPEIRLIGDLDILVPRAQIGTVIETLRPRGFRFGAGQRPRWGFIGDASFIPFHSPDGTCNIDLHIEPDAYPLHRGLDAQLLRDQARRLALGPIQVLVPSPTHQLMLLVSNAAKDRFFPSVLRKLIDVAALLRSDGASIEWRDLAEIADRARLRKALGVMVRLLLDLGMPGDWLGGEGCALAAPRTALYRQLLGQWQSRGRAANAAVGLLREPLLLYDWTAVVDRNWRRLSGMVRPRSGIPRQWREQEPTSK